MTVKIFSIVTVLLALGTLSSCRQPDPVVDHQAVASPAEVHMPDTIIYDGRPAQLITIDSTSFEGTQVGTITIDTMALIRDSALVCTCDSVLILRLESGDSVLLTSTPGIENDNYIGYVYLGMIKELNSYLIQVVYYEGGEYLLCNRRSGIKTDVIGVPVISPDARRVAFFNSDIAAGFTTNGFQIFALAADSLRPLWQASPNWGPMEGKWRDNNTLSMKVEYWDSLIRTKYIALPLPDLK